MAIMYIPPNDPKILELAQVGFGIYKGMKDSKAQEQQAEQGKKVQDLQIKAAESDLDTKKQENDPASPLSIAARDFAKRVGGITLPENVSAKQIKDGDSVLKAVVERQTKAQTEAKPTADQNKVATFVKRMEQAEDIFGGLEKGGYNRADTTNAAFDAVTPNAMLPQNRKSQDQAERNFINAVLRRESGAMISKEEFANAEQQYFPRAGDSADIKEQKRQNRLLAIEGLKTEAGPAYKKLATNVAANTGISKPGMVRANIQTAGIGGNSKPKTIKQGNFTYTLNEKTGQYE